MNSKNPALPIVQIFIMIESFDLNWNAAQKFGDNQVTSTETTFTLYITSYDVKERAREETSSPKKNLAWEDTLLLLEKASFNS